MRRRPQRVREPLGDPGDQRFGPVVTGGAARGLASVAGRPVAFQRLQRQAHNANDWYVLAIARTPVGPLSGASRPTTTPSATRPATPC